jgi:hypothetical protein
MLWMAFRSVVVDSWAAWGPPFLGPPMDSEAMENMDILLDMAGLKEVALSSRDNHQYRDESNALLKRCEPVKAKRTNVCFATRAKKVSS